MIRRPRQIVALAVPAVAAVVALTLSSCAPQAGAAATIGNRRISVSQVQDAYRDIVPIVGQDQQITQSQILNLLILEPYLAQAAAGLGRGVSDQDARLDISSSGTVNVNKLSHAGLEVWRANLANTALQSDRSTAEINGTYQAIGRELKAKGVHLNPRYGASIDYSNFSIVPEQPNWLKKTGATATQPSAQPTAP